MLYHTQTHTDRQLLTTYTLISASRAKNEITSTDYRKMLGYTLINTLHYITLETIYSGLSKNNFKDHYGNAATEQFPGMTTEINAYNSK